MKSDSRNSIDSQSEKRTASGATPSQRERIVFALNELLIGLCEELSLSPETVSLEMRYWHQRGSNPYRTNATKADKQRSYKAHGGKCHDCNVKIEFGDAVFHHLKRGVSNQHSPENLVPFCNVHHDNLHGARGGSLTKGSR